MILEIVTFKNRDALTRATEYEGARHSAQHWLKNPELIAKHFMRDGIHGGAVYIWPSIEAAKRAHDDTWRQSVIERTGGNEPEIRYLELMMSADPKAGTVKEYAAAGS